MRKRSLKTAVKEVKQNPNLWKPETLICLGHVDDFTSLCKFDDYYPNIVIVEEFVYVKTTSLRPHGIAASIVPRRIHRALDERFGDIFISTGSATRQFMARDSKNTLHGKEPDASLSISKKVRFGPISGSQVFPFLVAECGFRHEPLHNLFLEASNWLNEANDVQICILFSLPADYLKSTEFNIYVCQRVRITNEELARQTWKMEATSEDVAAAGIACEPIAKKRAEYLRKMTLEQIGEIYGIRIIQHIRLTDESFRDNYLINPVILIFSEGDILSRTNIPHLPDNSFHIDISSDVEEIYCSYPE